MPLQQPKNAFPACKAATLCYVYIVRAQGKHRKSEEEISDRKHPPPPPQVTLTRNWGHPCN